MTRPPEKIAVLCLSGLGNILLYTPALKRLKQLFPTAEIHFITIRKANFELIRHCPLVTPIFLEQKRYNSPVDNLKALMKCLHLRREKYDISFEVFPSGRIHYGIMSFLLGARRRVGFLYQQKESYLSPPFYTDLVTADPSLHDVEQNLKALELFPNSIPEDPTMEFWSTSSDRSRAEILTRQLDSPDRPLVAYHPTSFQDMTYKRWPLEHFAKVIDLVHARHNVTSVVFGEQTNSVELEKLQKLCRTPVHCIIDEPVLVVGEMLRRCALMISNDSGLMHLAIAAGTHALGIFGPTLDSRTGPWGPKGHTVISPYPGRPCRSYPFEADRFPNCCETLETGGIKYRKCMEMVTPEMVLGMIEARGLLAEVSPSL